jgi:hypothetical protein
VGVSLTRSSDPRLFEKVGAVFRGLPWPCVPKSYPSLYHHMKTCSIFVFPLIHRWLLPRAPLIMIVYP